MNFLEFSEFPGILVNFLELSILLFGVGTAVSTGSVHPCQTQYRHSGVPGGSTVCSGVPGGGTVQWCISTRTVVTVYP